MLSRQSGSNSRRVRATEALRLAYNPPVKDSVEIRKLHEERAHTRITVRSPVVLYSKEGSSPPSLCLRRSLDPWRARRGLGIEPFQARPSGCREPPS